MQGNLGRICHATDRPSHIPSGIAGIDSLSINRKVCQVVPWCTVHRASSVKRRTPALCVTLIHISIASRGKVEVGRHREQATVGSRIEKSRSSLRTDVACARERPESSAMRSQVPGAPLLLASTDATKSPALVLFRHTHTLTRINTHSYEPTIGGKDFFFFFSSIFFRSPRKIINKHPFSYDTTYRCLDSRRISSETMVSFFSISIERRAGRERKG